MPYVPSRRGWRERVAAASEQPASDVSTDISAPATKPPRRSRRRLRILLALNAFLAVLYAVNQLDESAVRKLGPAGEYVFDLLHRLTQLRQLDLGGLPITDSGLDALKDLPQLTAFSSTRRRSKARASPA